MRHHGPGNKYILVVMDVFSRWCDVAALPDTKADTLAATLWSRVISRYGLPIRMHSDQGPNLSAEGFRNRRRLLIILKATVLWNA